MSPSIDICPVLSGLFPGSNFSMSAVLPRQHDYWNEEISMCDEEFPHDKSYSCARIDRIFLDKSLNKVRKLNRTSASIR
ncbi:MAG: hypothetical protein ABSE00_06870 [Chitinispirillaceae bacterium]|jgi:hypothetical protein